MPRVHHLDNFYSDEIDRVQRAVSELVFLPSLLQGYLKTYVSRKYLGVMTESNPEAVVFKEEIPGSGSLISCILGVDAIVVELYTCSAATF
jgi:hypothetical protein